MKIKSTSLLSLFLIVVSTTFFTTSCKKNNDGGNSITATIGGTSFSPSATSALDEQGIIGVGGLKISGTDSTVLSIAFDDTVSLNKPLDITGPNSNTEVMWVSKTNAFDSWSGYSHGSLTVTTLDKNGKRVAGTFSGVIYSIVNGDSVIVTNGSFNSTYTSR